MKLAVLAASVALVGGLLWNTVAGTTDSAHTAHVAPALSAPAVSNSAIAASTQSAKLDTDKYPMEKTLAFSVRSISPEVVTSLGPSSLTITTTITNTGEYPLTDLIARVQRGTKQKTFGDVRQEIATPSQPEFVRPKDFAELNIDLVKNQTREITVTVPLIGRAPDSLRITAPGVYPLLLNVNATVTTPTQKFDSRVGGLYLMLSVTSVPTTQAVPLTAAINDYDISGITETALTETTLGGITAGGTAPPGSAPLQVNMLWPVMDRIHRGADGSFMDDDLAESIRTGGRLDTVLAVLEGASPPAGSVTLVLDPELLEELESMGRGYAVGAAAMDLDAIAEQLNADQDGTAVPGATTDAATSLPTTDQPEGSTDPPGPSTAADSDPSSLDETASITSEAATIEPATSESAAAQPGANPTDPSTQPTPTPNALAPGQTLGTGSADAIKFLDRLKSLITHYQALVLPYSDPDVAALTRATLAPLLSDSVIRGREVTDRVLGPSDQLIYDLSWPVAGAVNPATADALRQVGLTGMILSPSGVTSRNTNAQLTTSTGAMDIVVTDRLIEDVVDSLFVTGLPEDTAAMTMNGLAASTVQLGLGGTARSMVYTPDRQWLPDADGIQTWFRLLTTLEPDHLVAGTSLRSIAERVGEPTELRYSETAVAAELGQGTLTRVATLGSQAQSINDALIRTTSTGFEPLGVLDPLIHNLSAGASNSFRSDPILTAKWRKPLEDALAQISSRVSIVTPASSYTLTSTSSPIILRISNDLPFDIRVKVKIVNPERVGLVLQPPAEQTIPALRSRQIEIPATVNKPGQYPVTAVILTPDNVALGSPTILQINSTAYGAFTITMMITAGTVLVLTVGWRIGQRWKKRRERIRAEQAAAVAA